MNGTQELLLPGEVWVTQPRAGAFSLVLAGSEPDGRPLEAALVGPELAPLPARLHELTVASGPGTMWRMSAREGEFSVAGRALYVHRDLSDVLRRAIAPRPAPWRKRLFWRAVLLLAASAAGRELLIRLRSR